METFSAFLVSLCGEFTGHRWIPRTKASGEKLWCFLWSLIWTNSWANNENAGDLRRHRALYDVIVRRNSRRSCGILSGIQTSTSGRKYSISVNQSLLHPNQNKISNRDTKSMVSFRYFVAMWLDYFTSPWHSPTISCRKGCARNRQYLSGHTTSFWRHNDVVIIASCARRDPSRHWGLVVA